MSSRTSVLFQDACLHHRFIRGNIDPSCIVERPERIRAIKLGVAAAVARLEELLSKARRQPGEQEGPLLVPGSSPKPEEENVANGLADALKRLDLANDISTPLGAPDASSSVLNLIRSSTSVNLLDDAAVKFVHGDVDGDVYLENLISWATSSENKVAMGESEIPEGYPQGDLYRAWARNTRSSRA
jgi:histone deacetylase HOS3